MTEVEKDYGKLKKAIQKDNPFYHFCDTCKHDKKHWYEEPCHSCYTSDDGWEEKESE